jgi:hypothetical protein
MPRNDNRPLALLPAQLLRQVDDLAPLLGVRPAAAALLAGGDLPVPGRLHLGDKRRLLKLRDRAEHLAHQDCGR